MRIIPDDILDLVAGGRQAAANTDTTGIPSVTVSASGNGGDDGGGDGGWNPDPGSDSPSDSGGDHGSGGSSSSTTQHSSPAPAHVPENVDLNHLRNVADDLGKQLAAMTKIDGNEHGALIIRAVDGTLRTGPISTGNEDSNTATADLSQGEKVVAWIHDHPETPGVNEAFPSKTDVQSIRTLTANTSAVDPNALMYIVDEATHSTYEYDHTVSPNTNHLGNNISTDH
ncbi:MULTISPECIES: hypothetical protein [unclassified Janthinobacterium]|uniref:hypothetical protein n=1 Tax=unclassified Janthinobacterium TaxID=2610881 RepID=UPI00160D1B39|nr:MULTISPECIES: hypothetical protein [unclassified Janthinobacterium]MBB5369460.1 proteasome lid subunit RPN8/RPN11 [Janthinobacterium sp. K2C7]MBB5382584.1 proteasome lid subunit RPN8/RPN11 [Janthinobacterium sp. K2Li3]MBB5388161.1 proteasome lid subunit RPN8/RPN11 [Janthinobacterium sp. K2E3]